MRLFFALLLLAPLGCNSGISTSRAAVPVTKKAVSAMKGPARAKQADPPVGQTVSLTPEAWRGKLTAKQFKILREKGTERAFTGKYWKHKGDGVYRCAACQAPLFDSRAKFKSGTGWPSFWSPIENGRVEVQIDTAHGMERREIVCARCGGHLGHVFGDGPQPTGERYCVNSASMEFAEAPLATTPASR